MAAVRTIVPASRLLFGTDHPFSVGEIDRRSARTPRFSRPMKCARSNVQNAEALCNLVN